MSAELDEVWNEAFAEGYAEGYADATWTPTHVESYPGEDVPPEPCACPIGRDHTLREWIKWKTERCHPAEVRTA